MLKGLNTKKLYVNSLNHPSKSAKEIYTMAKNNSTELLEAKNNQQVYNKNNLNIINYISNIPGVGDNENSIVTLLKYGEFSMLFTGDASVETLYNLKEKFPNNITILKVGHHGAPGVINKNITEYLNPKYSIISTGENKF